MSEMKKYWAKVDKTETCWLWRGAKFQSGYGMIRVNGKLTRAHRFFYECLVGPIPPDKELDHLCRVRPCVNPDHLEAVAGKINTLRGTGPTAINARKLNCKRGHPLAGENLYIDPIGRRGCWTCMQEKDVAQRPTRKEYWRKYWLEKKKPKEREATRLLARLGE